MLFWFWLVLQFVWFWFLALVGKISSSGWGISYFPPSISGFCFPCPAYSLTHTLSVFLLLGGDFFLLYNFSDGLLLSTHSLGASHATTGIGCQWSLWADICTWKQQHLYHCDGLVFYFLCHITHLWNGGQWYRFSLYVYMYFSFIYVCVFSLNWFDNWLMARVRGCVCIWWLTHALPPWWFTHTLSTTHNRLCRIFHLFYFHHDPDAQLFASQISHCQWFWYQWILSRRLLLFHLVCVLYHDTNGTSYPQWIWVSLLLLFQNGYVSILIFFV